MRHGVGVMALVTLFTSGCGPGGTAASPAPPRVEGPMGILDERPRPLPIRVPGAPLRASVAFHAPLTPSAVLDILARHGVAPYLAQAWGGGVALYAQRPPEAPEAGVVAEAGRLLAERLAGQVCRVAERIASFEIDERALAGREGRSRRELLSRLLDERDALTTVREGGATIWAVYVTGSAADVALLAADPSVWIALPEQVSLEEGEALTGVPRPPEPPPVGRVEPRSDVAALADDEVARRLAALAAEPFPGCPSEGAR